MSSIIRFPHLLTVGNSRYYYGTAFEPEEDEVIIVRDEDSNSTNGITMVIPDSVLALNYMNLTTGTQGVESLDYNKYIYNVTSPNFSVDGETGVISVTVPDNTRYMECSGVTTAATIWVNGEAVAIDLTQPINGKVAEALVSGVTATANYVDDSAGVTFSFTGLDAEDLSWKIRKGTVPDLKAVEELVSYNGLAIKDITPEVTVVNGATTY